MVDVSEIPDTIQDAILRAFIDLTMDAIRRAQSEGSTAAAMPDAGMQTARTKRKAGVVPAVLSGVLENAEGEGNHRARGSSARARSTSKARPATERVSRGRRRREVTPSH
jgi:hypothetical protein